MNPTEFNHRKNFLLTPAVTLWLLSLVGLALALAIPARAETPAFSDADWASLGSGMNEPVWSLAVSGTNLYAGGYFTTADGMPANYIAQWNGSSWSALGSGFDGGVAALAVIGTNLYAGGDFANAGGVPANYIAKWDGHSWSALGAGLSGGPAGVTALAVIGTNLYAGGYFTTAGATPVNGIAKWDGNTWSALDSGVSGGGGDVEALAVIGTNLYAGGYFTTAGEVSANYIAQWNGSSWSPLGSGTDFPVWALAASGTNLFAGGDFTMADGASANYIAQWNGSSWSALGSGMDSVIMSLAASGTNLYAGGYFTTAGGLPANGIARWDGNAWWALGSGVSGGDGVVEALAADDWGHLFAGGDFFMAGTDLTSCIAQADLGLAPVILSPPQSQTAEAGSSVYFSSRVVGDPAVTCLWFFNGMNLMRSGPKAILQLTNVNSSLDGAYALVVTNVYGTATSSPAMLNVIPVVPRRPVPGVQVAGEPGSLANVDYVNGLTPPLNWTTLGSVSLTGTSQFYFDLTVPLPPQRFYRASVTQMPRGIPTLNLNFVPAITLSGNVGDSLELDWINQFGPTNAWVTLAAITLTNTSQLYFDVSALGQPPRLYQIVPAP